jgi:hypothetical protein
MYAVKLLAVDGVLGTVEDRDTRRSSDGAECETGRLFVEDRADFGRVHLMWDSARSTGTLHAGSRNVSSWSRGADEG